MLYKASVVVLLHKKDPKALRALYDTSNKYQMGRNGIVAKDWHSVNDGQQITVAFRFSSKEAADELLADPIFSPLTEYLL